MNPGVCTAERVVPGPACPLRVWPILAVTWVVPAPGKQREKPLRPVDSDPLIVSDVSCLLSSVLGLATRCGEVGPAVTPEELAVS